MKPKLHASKPTADMTRVLVLGSSGRIGTMLRHSWAWDMPDIDLSFQIRTRGTNEFVWDVMQPLPLSLQNAPPFDCMIVLSGVVPRQDANFKLNTAIGSASVKAAARLGIKHVLLASTSAVYGIHTNRSFIETDQTRPQNDYGRSKLAMEVTCQAQAEALGVQLCCLRIGNVAGADALLLNGASLFSGQKLQLDVFTDHETPVRSYIGPQTLARTLCSLVHKRANLPAILNVAAPHPVTMRALAEAANIPFNLTPTADSGHQYVTLDSTALARFHTFAPAESTPHEMVRQWQETRQVT